jgi:hypothetical protein
MNGVVPAKRHFEQLRFREHAFGADDGFARRHRAVMGGGITLLGGGISVNSAAELIAASN